MTALWKWWVLIFSQVTTVQWSLAFLATRSSTKRTEPLHVPSSTVVLSSASSSSTERPTTTPLSPCTFAGQVEQALMKRFSNIDRVIESWRLLESGYVHEEGQQLAHSYVPGLTVQEFWDTSGVDWCQTLQSKYKIIKQEFESVNKNPDKLHTGNNVWTGALTEDAAAYGEGWKTLVLMNRGMWDETNTQLFYKTAKILHDAKVPATEIFFASMQPQTTIAPHSDFTNFVLTSHLALDIPESGYNKCRLTIGNTTNQWENGNVMLFDTSLLHDAVNQADQTRYILMLRVWHPDLTQSERNALQFIYNVLEFPDLIADDPRLVEQAERNVEAALMFPKLETRASGFGAAGTPLKPKKQKRKKK